MDLTMAADAIAVATTDAANIGMEEAAQCSPFYIQVTIQPSSSNTLHIFSQKKSYILTTLVSGGTYGRLDYKSDDTF